MVQFTSCADYYLAMIGVKHSSLHRKEAIDHHVESSSMLSLKDLLIDYAVESVIGHDDSKISDFAPFAKAYPELETLVRNNSDIKVRVIFTASGEEDDLKTTPVAHLLAIQEKYGRIKVEEALDNWYLADKKDYVQFLEKYPMNVELKEQKEKIYAMRVWCDAM